MKINKFLECGLEILSKNRKIDILVTLGSIGSTSVVGLNPTLITMGGILGFLYLKDKHSKKEIEIDKKVDLIRVAFLSLGISSITSSAGVVPGLLAGGAYVIAKHISEKIKVEENYPTKKNKLI